MLTAKIFDKLTKYLTLIFVFFLPLIIVPFFTDPFDFGRQIYLLVFSTLIFAFWLIKSLLEKKIVIHKNLYFWPIILFLLVSILSTVINGVNKFPSFLALNGAINLFLGILVILLVADLKKDKTIFYTLIVSGAVLALQGLILFLAGFTFPITIRALNLSIGKAFSPTGNELTHLVVLLMLIPLGFALVYEQIKESKFLKAGLISVANVLMLCGVGISLYLLSNEAKPILLPQATAWAIAVETIKSSKMAILGISPGSFINAFTAFKPLSFNNSEFWNARFNTSSNWYYQILTELGILGLILYINLAWKILKNGIAALRKPKIVTLNLAVYCAIVILLIAQFFMPINLCLIFLFFILLALTESPGEITLDTAPLGNTVIIFLIFPIIAFGGLLFFVGKATLANVHFVNSIIAANKNDGVKTYNLQIKAIQVNSSEVNYHIAYAQTNLALANSLATKKDLTDQDRSTITQLVQQAIREAKAAVTLDPNNVAAWENLSTTYRQLINFAQGADQWTISAYQEAVKYDPLNPRLRVDLGGVYYSLQRFDEALVYFNQATALKPDFANAHYNMANALREKGALADAKREYEVAQSLVRIDSADYQKVTAELEEVKRRLPQPTPIVPASNPETLSTPQKPKPGIKPPVEVPEGAPPISPSSTITSTESPTPETP